ncbi:MAG: TonB-dependent receptor, partial [Holophagales bacterium]|nr:TonB-dependent receptor [Holophagales bacterium]
ADVARVRMDSTELEQIPAGRDPFGALGGVPGVEVDRPRLTAASAVVGGGAAVEASTFRVDGIDVVRPNYAATAAPASGMEVVSGGADASVPGPGVVVLLTSPERTPQRRAEVSASHVNPSWQAFVDTPIEEDPSDEGPGLSPVPGGELLGGTGSRLERSTLWSLDASGSLWRDRVWVWGAAQRREIEESRPEGARPRSELRDSAAKIQVQAWTGGSLSGSLYRNEWRRLGDGAGPDRAPETLRTAFEPSRWLALEASQLLRHDLRLGLSFLASNDAASFTPLVSESDPFEENRIVQGEDGVWRGGFAAFGREVEARGWRLEVEGYRPGGKARHDVEAAVEHRVVDTVEEERWGEGGYQLLAGENFGTPFDLVRAKRSGSLHLRRTTTSAWIQDRLTLPQKATRSGDWSLDFGLRFDAQQGTTGGGRAPANSLFPDLLPEVSYSGGDSVSWLDLSPRLAFAWSIGKANRTTVRAGYGRFASPLGAGVVGRLSPLGEAELVLGVMSADLLDLEADELENLGKNPDLVVVDRLGVDPFVPGSSTHPNTNAADLSAEVTDELRLSVEQRLSRATSLYLEWVSRIVSDVLEARRFLRDETGAVRLALASDYALESVISGLFPDGTPYSAPVYGLREGLELTGGALLVNGDREQHYEAVTLGLERRLTRGFRLRAHATLSDWRWQVGEEFAL